MSNTQETLDRFKASCTNLYTESDGGDWYIVINSAAGGGRLGEDFCNRNTARLVALWMATGEKPDGWKVEGFTRLAISIDCDQGYSATIWRDEVARLYPDFLKSLEVI